MTTGNQLRGGCYETVKRILLGSAAGIFTVTGAQAADLRTKVQPVEYVSGPGF
jgi:hypothetical protein